ncbi:DUF3888 domain-containing protein [Paenibacillus sp. 1781tsa1]|uniref:DUF3888 domain-containing protein n=1 Tax=Paenibacillus sp. 1781tsa1 TaxID=2953810 RepID=UPI00209CF59B|nr:DUF3888 domain-containing protein [Paenibacillus sp. 1781tsa1]MCP1184206.1 DUF3888 domain-containing protein [Paenibacillus sp. 1781tsa1]
MVIQKQIFLSILAAITLMLNSVFLSTDVTYADPEFVQQENYKALALTILNPYIAREITSYYQENHMPVPGYGLYDMNVLELKRRTQGGYSFRTVLEVRTFYGPHNPPYGKEIITFDIDTANVTMVNYVHTND